MGAADGAGLVAYIRLSARSEHQPRTSCSTTPPHGSFCLTTPVTTDRCQLVSDLDAGISFNARPVRYAVDTTRAAIDSGA